MGNLLSSRTSQNVLAGSGLALVGASMIVTALTNLFPIPLWDASIGIEGLTFRVAAVGMLTALFTSPISRRVSFWRTPAKAPDTPPDNTGRANLLVLAAVCIGIIGGGCLSHRMAAWRVSERDREREALQMEPAGEYSAVVKPEGDAELYSIYTSAAWAEGGWTDADAYHHRIPKPHD